jgi:hypothetical protein
MLFSFPRFFSGREGCRVALAAARLFVLYVYVLAQALYFFLVGIFSNYVFNQKK